MIVVADTTPLHYLTLIGAINVLLPLYDRVLVPQTVVTELQQPNTPAAVRAWIAQPPAWCEIHPIHQSIRRWRLSTLANAPLSRWPLPFTRTDC